MTTIAYRDGVLAADTLATAWGGVVERSAFKIGGRNGVLWAATGDSAWGKKFRDWCVSGMRGDYPTPPDEHSVGTVYPPNGDLLVFHMHGIEHRSGLPFWAGGSGCDYALGAMQMGATAEEAVRAAMFWDHRTGGDVVTVRR